MLRAAMDEKFNVYCIWVRSYLPGVRRRSYLSGVLQTVNLMSACAGVRARGGTADTSSETHS